MAAESYTRALTGTDLLPAVHYELPAHRGWAAMCVAALIPYTAVLHHAIFYHQECMLNPFGADYTPAVVVHWLGRDPSLLAAALLAIVTYHVGLRLPAVRRLLLPLFLAFLPLSLWVWDLPFSGRLICHTFHDMRPMLPGGAPLRGGHFYLLAGTIFPVLVLLGRHQYAKANRLRRLRAADLSGAGARRRGA